MRDGMIVNYNTVIKIGIIKDLNSQKIKFFNKGNTIYKLFDMVCFEIELSSIGLIAVNVQILKLLL